MKKLYFILVFFGFALWTNAQIAPNKYWVQFTDKNNSPYSIGNPEAFLSQRALWRRANQRIAIDEYDLPVTPVYLRQLSQTGAKILNVSKWLNGTTIAVDDDEVLQAVRTLPYVSYVRACTSRDNQRKSKEETISEEVYNLVPSFYGNAFEHINTINGKPLHDAGFMGKGMLIAVIDGGFAGADTISLFKVLRDEGRLVGTRNFVDKEETVFKGSQHGTSCLGLIAGYLPNEYVGTAPQASFFLMVSEDVYSENIIEEYNWVSAAELADSLGVDVCSTSLGYVDFDMVELSHTYNELDGNTTPVSRGAAIACSRGMLCVNSAGNSGQNDFPYIGVPADVEPVLTVGAVNASGVLAPFSSVGPTYDQRIKPDVVAMGLGDMIVAYNGTFYYGNGTSFSCPIIAGMSSCLWQSRPCATPSEIVGALRKTADRAESPDNRYGYGVPDFDAAMKMLPEKKDIETDSLILVFPNPSSGDVHVCLNDALSVDIVVNNIMGQRLLVYEFNGLNRNGLERKLNSLRAGVYFLTAYTNNHQQTVKLVVK